MLAVATVVNKTLHTIRGTLAIYPSGPTTRLFWKLMSISGRQGYEINVRNLREYKASSTSRTGEATG